MSDRVNARQYRRAIIDAGEIPQRALAIPTDLVRHDMFIRDSLCRDEDIAAIVNDCAIPLLAFSAVATLVTRGPAAKVQPVRSLEGHRAGRAKNKAAVENWIDARGEPISANDAG